MTRKGSTGSDGRTITKGDSTFTYNLPFFIFQTGSGTLWIKVEKEDLGYSRISFTNRATRQRSQCARANMSTRDNLLVNIKIQNTFTIPYPLPVKPIDSLDRGCSP